MRAQEASRRALAAVARLTIIASAVGCGSSVAIEKDDGADGVEAGEGAPNEVPDYVVDVPEETCFDGAIDSAKCCGDLLAESFKDNTLFDNPELATDEDKACCDLAATVMDAWFGSGAAEPPFDYALTSACCGTGLVEGGWEKHPSCTPWGPPMPPAMPRGLDLALFEVLA